MSKRKLGITGFVGTCAAAGALVLGASGCSATGAQGGCADGTGCGGDPTGTWNANGVCQYSPPQASQPLSFSQYMQAPQDPILTAPAPNPTTAGDWCSELQYLPAKGVADGMVANVNLWHAAVPFSTGSMTFNSDHSYSTTLNFQTTGTTHFSPPCIQSQGMVATCDQLANAITAFYANKAMNAQTTDAFSGPDGPDGSPIQCNSASDNGCDCSYTYKVALTDQGNWATTDGVLTQNSVQYAFNKTVVQEVAPQAPMSSTYCASGSSLTMTGYQGQSLEYVLGLRTLTFQKM